MRDIRAVFFDIDGTLVSFNTHAVPRSAVEALAELRRRGIMTFIATGRMPSMIPLPAEMEFDGYVTYNGALCLSASGETIFANPLPHEDLTVLAGHLKHDKFAVAFLKRHDMTVNLIDERLREMVALIDIDLPRIEDPEISIREEVYQLCIYVDRQKERQVLDSVLRGCESNRWSEIFADVNARGNDKALGIEQMITRYGIDREQIMAFGDGGNDTSMLRYAGVGVAMGGAAEEVRGAADYVAATVDDDGIASALRHFGLI